MIEDGLHTEWWENGQKKLEVTYKNGKPDGLGIVWYKNCLLYTSPSPRD